MLAANQLINKILQTKDYSIIKSNSLDKSYFGDYGNEFTFIDDHVKMYGNVPDQLTFMSKFQDFELTEVNETNDYLLDKLYEEFGYSKFAEMLPELNKHLKADSRDAYNYLMTVMPQLKPHAVCKGTDIIAQAMERYELFRDRANNPDKMNIKTGLQELDEIFGGWEFGDELVTIVARTNMGKCFVKNTLVRCADGSLKKIQDIKIGDKVQSYNGINIVTGLHCGKDTGYKIIPARGGDPFIVTNDHILTVWHRSQIWDSIKKQSTTNGEGQLIDLTIEEYLAKSKSFQRNCRLFRPSIDYSTKDLIIPPYILGIWLGDGTSREPDLTNVDKSVVESWCNYGKSLGVNIKEVHKSNSKAIIYRFTSKGTNLQSNPFRNSLNELKLINNKHIPLDYLTGDKQQRLELLAGLIDTDGHYDKRSNMFEISTKSEILADNYCQLLRGLGFKTTKRVTHNKKYNKNYYRVTFSGSLHEIPCRVEYKKQQLRYCKIERNSQLTNFKVERIDKEFEYYGFECDGDHRFLLADNTLVHNSWICLKFLVEAWKQGYRVGLYSGEMNHIKLGYRFDALFNHFSNRALVQGAQTDGYLEYAQNLMTINNPFIIITQSDLGGKPTVQKLRSFVEENQIDILGVDQLSLMEDGRASMRDPSRLRLGHIAEDLFLLSSDYKIPILALAQANREAVKKEGETDAPGLENIKESDDIAHNSSKCIGMRQSNFGLVLDIIKNREGRVGDKLLYSWDIDTGNFSYIPSADDAARPATRQQFAQANRDAFSPSAAANPF